MAAKGSVCDTDSWRHAADASIDASLAQVLYCKYYRTVRVEHTTRFHRLLNAYSRSTQVVTHPYVRFQFTLPIRRGFLKIASRQGNEGGAASARHVCTCARSSLWATKAGR